MKSKPTPTTPIVLDSPPPLPLRESSSKESSDKEIDKEDDSILKTPTLEKPDSSNPLMPEQPNIPSTPLVQPTFYRPPKKIKKETPVSVKKRKHNRIMKLTVGMPPYDILNDLDKMQPQISLRQLLALSPLCKNELTSSLVRKRPKTTEEVNVKTKKDRSLKNKTPKIVDVHDISVDPGAPTVDVMIDGALIEGAQVDSGSSVNLMNVDTMEELGLTNMTSTPIILRMADQSRVVPLGILKGIITNIGGLRFKINYIVFKVSESISTYPILLGRPWLKSARVKDDWGKGTLTIGRGRNKVVLPMFPAKYHGETQDEDSEYTTEVSSESDPESTNYVTQKCLPLSV